MSVFLAHAWTRQSLNLAVRPEFFCINIPVDSEDIGRMVTENQRRWKTAKNYLLYPDWSAGELD